MRRRFMAHRRRAARAGRARRSAADLPDAAQPREARAAFIVRRDSGGRTRSSDRAGDAVGRGSARRTIHYDPGPSRLSGDSREARRALARLAPKPSRMTSTRKKGTRRGGSPFRPEPFRSLLQMVRQMLVHLEHADPVLTPKDLLQLVVRHDFSFVL